MKTYLKIKEELKEKARELRLQKRLFKSKQRSQSVTLKDLQERYQKKWEYRHRHIARCLLRGTPYEKIEQKVRQGNEADQKLIQKYKVEYEDRINEEKEINENAKKIVNEIIKEKGLEQAILGSGANA